ncbi:MAG: helix-turn-helix transcriptional regulator [Paludibacteraceae bacterium]|nr:helix-turn-helix transcriptional regulator [Paludibacteraceae bacterium]
METEKNQRISAVADYLHGLGFKNLQIAEALGVSPAYVSDLFKGNKSIGAKLAYKLEELYKISPSWLIFGEGEMTASKHSVEHNEAPVFQNNGNGDNNVTQTAGTPSATIDKLIAEMRESRIEKDRQIDRLLTIIENMQNK